MHRLVVIFLITSVTAEPLAFGDELQRQRASFSDTVGVSVSQGSNEDWMRLDRLYGSPVRVRQVSGSDVTGQLTSTSSDALVIGSKKGSRSLRKADICKVTIRERDQSRTIGWIVGLTLVGLVFGILNTHVNEGARSPALFAVIGAGIGALVGVSPNQRSVYENAALCTSRQHAP